MKKSGPKARMPGGGKSAHISFGKKPHVKPKEGKKAAPKAKAAGKMPFGPSKAPAARKTQPAVKKAMGAAKKPRGRKKKL